MATTNDQAALVVNQRFRPRAEALRALCGYLQDDTAAFVGDIHDYFVPTSGPSAWTDGRTDVPHNVTAADVVAFAALESAMLAAFTPETLALVAKFCVRPVSVG